MPNRSPARLSNFEKLPILPASLRPLPNCENCAEKMLSIWNYPPLQSANQLFIIFPIPSVIKTTHVFGTGAYTHCFQTKLILERGSII